MTKQEVITTAVNLLHGERRQFTGMELMQLDCALGYLLRIEKRLEIEVPHE